MTDRATRSRRASSSSPRRTSGCSGSTAAARATWSGRRSILGLARRRRRLADLRRRARARSAGTRPGRARWSATTCSRCSPGEVAATAATRRSAGSATSATPPPRPAGAHRAAASRTRSGCGSATRSFVDHDDGDADPRGLARPADAVRDVAGRRTPRAFAEVQEQLRLGNSYEVNLTYRESAAPARRPGRRPTSGCGRSTPRRTPGTCSTTACTLLLSSSPERFATIDRDRVAGDQADQGHHAARRAPPPRTTRAAATGWPPTRSSAPRT